MHNRMWCKGSHLHLSQRVAELQSVLSELGIDISEQADPNLPALWLFDSLELDDIPKLKNPFVPQFLILDFEDTIQANPEWFSHFSDVLIWKSPQQVAQRIAARFKRIQTIQERIEQCSISALLTGCSVAWQKALFDLTEAALFSDAPILITGENGTGKELAAQWVHAIVTEHSPLSERLTTVDCTQFNRDLMGSELFGHVKGAFTGAISHRYGAIAEADKGMLFLDEIGEIPLELQSALLRVLQEGTYKPVGSNEWKKAQFRLVCATNRNLMVEQQEHRFRTDLFYRINGWHCHLPSLKERASDIIPLTIDFLHQNREYSTNSLTLKSNKGLTKIDSPLFYYDQKFYSVVLLAF
jgi:transcriptional regulator with GAF, ATPase, and Fis domain